MSICVITEGELYAEFTEDFCIQEFGQESLFYKLLSKKNESLANIFFTRMTNVEKELFSISYNNELSKLLLLQETLKTIIKIKYESIPLEIRETYEGGGVPPSFLHSLKINTPNIIKFIKPDIKILDRVYQVFDDAIIEKRNLQIVSYDYFLKNWFTRLA